MVNAANSPALPQLGRPWRDRFPGPDPQPVDVGHKLELHEGMRVLGFWPTERQARLSCRRIGPEPEAVIFIGALAPEVQTLRLTFLAPADPAPFGLLRLFYEDQPLPQRPTLVPETVAALVPQAWAVQASLPAVEDQPRPAWARLEIRISRTLPDAAHARWVGPALHAVEFLG
ncbi:hypothetical protein [Roseomonas marmotae]|uniref:Uncharacterized protein n=1 Tax=Roseomonas marmotae TaxID=2768161 RepID=A0ABS3KEE8_9PROT|nr:hypothetical protein [Roseomonas marmotae]MBO1075807.1 hypothetical protein [Roseomonas marmotae]QTI80529.1 hypothetical protein IAI58_07275 [Roseomonas marmotae]